MWLDDDDDYSINYNNVNMSQKQACFCKFLAVAMVWPYHKKGAFLSEFYCVNKTTLR